MSVNNLDNILWTEKYRPKNLAELIVPQRIKKIFDGGVVQSMLLHGTAGIGNFLQNVAEDFSIYSFNLLGTRSLSSSGNSITASSCIKSHKSTLPK